MAASSICRLASHSCACLPNILRMRSTLSRAIALIGRRSSFILYNCAGLRTFPMMSRLDQDCFISSMISSNFPEPM